MILIVLGLQGVATFFSVYSNLWPFKNYPMYTYPVPKDSQMDRYSVFAVYGAAAIPLRPHDMGLNNVKFRDGFLALLRGYTGDARDRAKLEEYLALYARWSGGERARWYGPLRALRLENNPLFLTPQGPAAAPPTTVVIRLTWLLQGYP